MGQITGYCQNFATVSNAKNSKIIFLLYKKFLLRKEHSLCYIDNYRPIYFLLFRPILSLLLSFISASECAVDVTDLSVIFLVYFSCNG